MRTIFRPRPSLTLRQVNNLLTAFLIVLAVYIMAAPFWPQVEWWWQHRHPQAAVQAVLPAAKAKAPIPKDNLLVIPRLNMSQEIHTGPSMYELNKGVWLIPGTSTPDKASNTVMAGHRFTYAGPAVFYFLDKVQLHDPIVVDWHGKEYSYRVDSIKVVPPTQTSVAAATPKPELTVYTCTPLWTAKNRLVIQADLMGVRS